MEKINKLTKFYTKFKWYITELIKMLSDEPSFFSQKRFQTWSAFILFISGTIITLVKYVKTVEDFNMWSIPILLICGYTLNATQKEKKNE